MLVRGAYSANVKERRDLSTALFDADGRLIAQAAHIPVHLGAMPDAVAAVIAREPGPGDVFVLNDPFVGGTHLPDITLVSTVTVDGATLAYAVSRAHHSDVGGMRAGSIPPNSTEILQEGIVIPPVRLVRAGELAARPARPRAGERADPGHAPRRPARAARGRGGRAGAAGGPRGPARRRPRARRHGEPRRVRRAPRAGRGGRAAGRRVPGRGRAGGRRDHGRRHPDPRGGRDPRRARSASTSPAPRPPPAATSTARSA